MGVELDAVAREERRADDMLPARRAQVRRRIFVMVVGLCCAFLCAVESARLFAQEDAAAGIERIFAPLATDKSPGVAVLVRKNGRTVFERGYGTRELRTFAKIDAQTNFRLASCSKQFTAMAVMLLVHDGKLGYNEKLRDVFPDFPAYGKAI